MNWQDNLIQDVEDVRELIRGTKRIAVLGIKTEAQADQPSVYVPAYMKKAGFEIVPVPVYYPHVAVILGEYVCRQQMELPGALPLVDLLRRSPDITGPIDDVLAKQPKSVWFQSGIRN